eukprot:TCONS_00053831-protein
MIKRFQLTFLLLACSLISTVSVTPAKFPCHAEYLDIKGDQESYVNLTGTLKLPVLQDMSSSETINGDLFKDDPIILKFNQPLENLAIPKENSNKRMKSDDDKQHHIFLKSTEDLIINETFYLNFTAQPKVGIGGKLGIVYIQFGKFKCPDEPSEQESNDQSSTVTKANQNSSSFYDYSKCDDFVIRISNLSDGYEGKFNIPLNLTKDRYRMTVHFASPVETLIIYHGLYTPPKNAKDSKEFIIQNQHEISSAIDDKNSNESKLNLFFKVRFIDADQGMEVTYIHAGRFKCGHSTS